MTPRDRSSGFILVAVLAITALLAGLVASVSLLVRSGLGTVQVEVDSLAGDALLRAGLEVAAYELLTLGEKVSTVDGQLIRLDDGTITVFVVPAGGRADLNTSDPALLEAVYKSSGLKRMKPDEFAARIVDWRDPDRDTTPKGAEADAYAAAGVPFGPADDAFRRVDDLRWVLGVAPVDVPKLAGFFTVHNPKGTVNLFDAPREVLEALPGFRKQTVDRILKLRVKRTDQVAVQLLQLVPGAEKLVNADVAPDRTMVKVRLEARPTRGASRTVEAVLIQDPLGRQAFRVVGWSERTAAAGGG